MPDEVEINVNTEAAEEAEESGEDTWRNQSLLALTEISNLQRETLSALQNLIQNQVSETMMRTLLETNTQLTAQLAEMATRTASIQTPSTVIVETPTPLTDTPQVVVSESAPSEVVAEELPAPVSEVPRPKRRRI